MTALLKAPARPEEALIAPGDDVRCARGDLPVAARAGVGLVRPAQVADGELGPTGTGVGTGQGRKTTHVEGDVGGPVGTLRAASCHGPDPIAACSHSVHPR